jgi:predicted transcriptional regulator
MNPRRTKMQIYVDILTNIQRSGGMRKTHIVYKSNLTHVRLKEYMDYLLSKELVSEDRRQIGTVITITKKGVKFLSDISKLRKLSDAFGVPI